MRCDELRARLDAAGPTGLSATHQAHARGCAACAAELQAAQAVETMLRAEPPTPSVAFTARVLDRVEATERARQRVAESPRSSAWGRWWRGIAEEPIAIVALALAPVPILLGVLWPGTAGALTAFVRDGFAAWVAAAHSGALFARSGMAGLSDPVRAITDSVAIPALIVVALLGFQVVGEAFGGSDTSARRAHKPSTSRRRPS